MILILRKGDHVKIGDIYYKVHRPRTIEINDVSAYYQTDPDFRSSKND